MKVVCAGTFEGDKVKVKYTLQQATKIQME
jgi:hypothetical protein